MKRVHLYANDLGILKPLVVRRFIVLLDSLLLAVPELELGSIRASRHHALDATRLELRVGRMRAFGDDPDGVEEFGERATLGLAHRIFKTVMALAPEVCHGDGEKGTVGVHETGGDVDVDDHLAQSRPHRSGGGAVQRVKHPFVLNRRRRSWDVLEEAPPELQAGADCLEALRNKK